MRPRSLRDVVLRTRADPSGDWDHHLREFLDAFYGADGDRERQAGFIIDAPGFVDDPRADAFLGGVGEHLARRWRLPIPSWVRHEARYLDRAMFVPGDRSLRRYLICVSPVAFRSRLIFTGPDPLQRARFPYHRGLVRFPPVCPRDAQNSSTGPFPAPMQPSGVRASISGLVRVSMTGLGATENQPGQSAEMVAVQMREKDRADAARIEAATQK